jgi:hypothetical protein
MATKDRKASKAREGRTATEARTAAPDRPATRGQTETQDLLDLMAVRAHLARRAIRDQSVNRVRQAMLDQMERQAQMATRDP